MSLCPTCQNIDLPSLPTFHGFNSKLSPHDVRKVPPQLHHASFKNLKLSAQGCPLRAVFLLRFQEAVAQESEKIYASGPPPDDAAVTLRGLNREGWSEYRKLLYGVQVAWGSWFHNFGLYADEGEFETLSLQSRIWLLEDDVAEYTKRHLSYGDNKLPALSGLARVYSKHCRVDCVAGLGHKTYGYRAPSWSWASVDGPVDFFSINAEQVLADTIDFEDGEHWIDLAGKDPYGRLEGGTLTLKGYIREAMIRTIEEDSEYEGVRLTKQLIYDEISAIGSVTLQCLMVQFGV